MLIIEEPIFEKLFFFIQKSEKSGKVRENFFTNFQVGPKIQNFAVTTVNFK